MDFPVFMLERSPLVLRDLDLIREIARRSYATVAFSVMHTAQSPNAAQLDRMEGLAPRPALRFAAMQELSKAGIRTGICLMPILPGLGDTRENLEAVIRRTADAGGQFVLASPLTLSDQQKTYFMDYLQNSLPDLYPLYQGLYPPKSYGPAGGPLAENRPHGARDMRQGWYSGPHAAPCIGRREARPEQTGRRAAG